MSAAANSERILTDTSSSLQDKRRYLNATNVYRSERVYAEATPFYFFATFISSQETILSRFEHRVEYYKFIDTSIMRHQSSLGHSWGDKIH